MDPRGPNREQVEKDREQPQENGEPYSSPALVRLDGETALLGYQARQMERRYRELMGDSLVSA